MGWYSENWSYRQAITVDHTKVGADLTDFPIAVRISDPANPVFSKARSDGHDLLLTGADGTTKLSHERAVWDQTAKVMVLFFKASSLSSAADTVFYLYYGNPASGDQQNGPDVWTNGYRGVYHLDGAPGTVIDSTAGTHNGTSSNMDAGDLVAGLLGKAHDFDGSNDYVDIPHHADFDPGNAFTVFLCIYQHTQGWRAPLTKRSCCDDATLFEWSLQADGGNNRLYWGVRTDTGTKWVTGNVPPLNSWYSGHGVWEGTQSTLYQNGLQTAQLTGITGTAVARSGINVKIGARSHSASPYYGDCFDGLIDEVRIAQAVRSPGWVLTEHNSTVNNGSFFSLEAEEAQVALSDAALSFAAYYQGLDDAPIHLAAFYQAFEDAGLDLGAIHDAMLHDATLVLSVLGQALSDAGLNLRTGKGRLIDARILLSAVSSLVFLDAGICLLATDGILGQDARLYLSAVKQPPTFRASVAQRLSSILSEV